MAKHMLMVFLMVFQKGSKMNKIFFGTAIFEVKGNISNSHFGLITIRKKRGFGGRTDQRREECMYGNVGEENNEKML